MPAELSTMRITCAFWSARARNGCARGVSQRALALDPGVVFSVTALELRYLRPARLDDLLAISCEPVPAAGARVGFRQRIWRGGVQGEALLEACVHIACLDRGA